MRIIIILKLNPFYDNSASANRWRTLIEGLGKLGAVIELLITGGYNNPHECSELGRKGVYKGIKYQYLSLMFHHNIWLRRINTFILNSLIQYWILFRVKKIISYNRDVILWSDTNYDSFRIVVSLKRKYPKLKTFLELNEFLDIHKYNKGNALQRMKADKRQHFFEERAFYAYTGLALMTKTLFNHYQGFQQPLPKLLHLPMTVDIGRFNTNVPLLRGFEKPYIAFVGVMNDAKDGVSILIEAFNTIKSTVPDLKLYLIGGWNYDTPNHKQLIKKYDLENKVFLKGEYSRDLIPAIVCNASILALPRPDSKQARGGFPTKLGEYLASGNPVCATKVGEIPDYLIDGETVYFAQPGSVTSFANALHRVLSNPREAKKTGLNGQKVAELHFNQDTQAKVLFDFLSKSI